MRPKLLIIIILFISFSIQAQKDIEIFDRKSENELIIYGKNNTDLAYDVTITITERTGLRGSSKPVTKRMPPNSELKFMTFTFKGKYNYKYVLNSKPIITKPEVIVYDENKRDYYLKDFADLNKGIVVFDKTDCPRCNRATAYLIDNGIDFKIVDITEKGVNNRKMWELLRANGIDGKNITTPVFLVNGKLTHSHKNLGDFLESLKQ